jgi:4-diphosphocytidyl-2-C-methyl-D-erythritol kinase
VRLNERAAAKINLTLHVRGRLANGYHALESLVLFAGVHDRLSLQPADDLALTVTGPRGGSTGPLAENLVVKAANALAARVSGLKWGHFTLLKRLPAAAGIGGGSADAAAALRLLAQLNGLSLADDPVMAAAQATGADVPVCLAPTAQMMRGMGEALEPLPQFPALFAVLVNPGVSVETRAAFMALGLQPGQDRGLPDHPVMSGQRQHDRANLATLLQACRNDFEPTAIASAPDIGEAIAMIRALPQCWLARMSGSGATCYGLFGTCHEAAAAARQLKQQRPGWWIEPTVLR